MSWQAAVRCSGRTSTTRRAASTPEKIGPDADDKAGGCDNIRIIIPATGSPQVEFWRGAEDS